MNHEGPLHHLIKMLAGLPGLGNRSGRRIALHLLAKRRALMLPLAEALRQAAEEVKECGACGNLDMHDPCAVCRDIKRDRSKICVVAQVSDLWAIERSHMFKGHYHVLGGTLSALDGRGLPTASATAKDAKAKDVALKAAVSQIEREFGAGAVMKLGSKNVMDVEIDELRLEAPCPLVGRMVSETLVRRRHGLLVVAVKRADGRMVFNPDADFTFQAGDTIVVMGKPQDIQRFCEENQL